MNIMLPGNRECQRVVTPPAVVFPADSFKFCWTTNDLQRPEFMKDSWPKASAETPQPEREGLPAPVDGLGAVR